MRASHGQFDDLLSFFDADEVVVEEVDVQPCLQDATQDLSPAVEVVHEVSVHPISLIESEAKLTSSKCRRICRDQELQRSGL